jgi:hypothetical protein
VKNIEKSERGKKTKTKGGLNEKRERTRERKKNRR